MSGASERMRDIILRRKLKESIRTDRRKTRDRPEKKRGVKHGKK